MKREEIKRKFDEIVAFSEIEQFLDTPVKRYSSGMYVRLAFAVAAHLEPEILIVDEVLAVGDLDFQQKCLDKMDNVAANGRSILFVSHNLQAVRHLCSRVVILERGETSFNGEVAEGVSRYFEHLRAGRQPNSRFNSNVSNVGDTHIQSIRFVNQRMEPIEKVTHGDTLGITFQLEIPKQMRHFELAMAIIHASGSPVFSETTADSALETEFDPGAYEVTMWVDVQYFKMEPYYLTVFLLEDGKPLFSEEGIPLPQIDDVNAEAVQESRRWGVVRLPVSWSPFKSLS
jgi:lipopolysaccharide transport system ATP-binding protein